jgi:hypothetical protein
MEKRPKKNPADSTPKVAERRAFKVRKLRNLDDIDGRTLSAQRARALVRSIEADLGRDPSTGERQLALRAGLLAAIIEDIEARWVSGDAIEIDAYTKLINSQRRVLMAIGLERRPRDVSPRTLDDASLHRLIDAVKEGSKEARV